MLGYHHDAGGILSVIRGIVAASEHQRFQHMVWVRSDFQERRSPALDYRISRFTCAESLSLPGLLLGTWELFRAVRKERFQVLHAHSRCGLAQSYVVSALLRIPVLFTNHAFARRRTLYRFVSGSRRMSTVLLNGRMATHYGISPSPPKVSIISACAADSFFRRPLRERDHAEAERREMRIAGIGALVDRKRWNLLIRAVAGLEPDIRQRLQVDIWGEPGASIASKQYASGLAALIRETGLEDRVRLRGPTANPADVLDDADWFILPSVEEPCSVALIEALALGVPAIVSDSGGSPDIVRDGATGLVFRTDDERHLRTTLEKVAAGTQPTMTPSKIRASVHERSAAVVAEQYAAVYEHLTQTLR